MSKIADSIRIKQTFDPEGNSGGYKCETITDADQFITGTLTTEMMHALTSKLFEGVFNSGGIITGSKTKPEPIKGRDYTGKGGGNYDWSLTDHKPDGSPAIDSDYVRQRVQGEWKNFEDDRCNLLEPVMYEYQAIQKWGEGRYNQVRRQVDHDDGTMTATYVYVYAP